MGSAIEIAPGCGAGRRGTRSRTRTSARSPQTRGTGSSGRPLRNRRIAVSNALRAGGELPGGIRAFATPRASEVVFQLPDQRAHAVGDLLLGARAKPGATGDLLRLCRERRLGPGTRDGLHAMFAPLLEAPVERTPTPHGEPVLSGGRGALAGVLA